MADLFFISALIAAVFVFIRLVYLSLLPKPIPGIPCNKDSRGFWLDFFTDLLSKHKTPIAQIFPGPFERAHVVIGDYREARDLMTKRSKDLGLGYRINVSWRGVLPEHFIAMNSFHPSFKEAF